MNLEKLLQILRKILAEGRGREEWIIKVITITFLWITAIVLATKVPKLFIEKVPIVWLFIVSLLLPVGEKIMEKIEVV